MQEEIVTSENTEADLGTIYEEEGLARTVLVVRNNSADTLFPVAAYSHCRCAAATVSPLPVAPGEDVRIDVTFDNPRPETLAYRQKMTLDAHGRDTLHFRFTMPAGLSSGDTLRFALRPSVNGKPVGKDLNVKAISPGE